MIRGLPLALLLAGCVAADPDDAVAPPLRVMSYNIRYGTAPDGNNHWDRRKDLCTSRAVVFDPDLLGLQEALDFQNDHFQTALGKDYGRIGVGREDGKAKGEFSTIFFRTSRLEPVASGTFWLSETPDVPGSKSWDSALPRIATWARLRDLRAGGRELLFVNTHFDHKGVKARVESAKLLRAFIDKEGRGGPVVVTGDFNSAPASEAHRILTGGTLTDAWPSLHPEPAEGSAHGFTGKAAGVPRIDWILGSAAFEAKEASIDRFHKGDLYPSDHFPVSALLAWR